MPTALQLAKFRARFPNLPAIATEWRDLVVANPDDDELRAVYADWLLEREDPLGELIQVQRRMASPEGVTPQLSEREDELLRKVVVRDRRWRSLRGWITHELEALGATSCTIRLGFVERFEIDAARMLASGPALLALAPVTTVFVRDTQNTDVAALAEMPQLARIRDLTIVSTTHGINDAGAAALASSPHTVGLRRLALWRGTIRASGLGKLCRDGALPNLRELELSNQPLRSVKELVAWSGVRRLESLVLRSCELDATAAADLAAAPFDHLTALELSRNPLRVAGARALAAAAHMGSLVFLHVDGCSLTERGIDEIVSSPNLPALRELQFDGENITDAERTKLRNRLASPRTGDRRVAAPAGRPARPARKRGSRARDP